MCGAYLSPIEVLDNLERRISINSTHRKICGRLKRTAYLRAGVVDLLSLEIVQIPIEIKTGTSAISGYVLTFKSTPQI